MLNTVLTIVILSLVVFLLAALLINNVNEWYDPYIDITYDIDGKRLVVLWYNHVTDSEVKREHKILFKL